MMPVRKEKPLKFFLLTVILGGEYADKHIVVSQRVAGEHNYFAKLRKLKDWALISRQLSIAVMALLAMLGTYNILSC